MSDAAAAPGFPRLTYLRIKNYRSLRDVELRDLTPLTVFIGPNGSGKSTVLDALAFLAEAVGGDLKGAWERRNRFAGMQTRGQEGLIMFQLNVEVLSGFILRYCLSINEENGILEVVDEFIDDNLTGKSLISYSGSAYSQEDRNFAKQNHLNFYEIEENPDSTIMLNANTTILSSIIGLAFKHTRVYETVIALHSLLESYRYIHLTDDHLKGYSDAGPREKLSANGDNLPNVLYYLHTKHPEALARITAQLRRWVPSLADIVTEITSDERLLLRFKDAPFEKPLPAQYMSDGTMRLAALLTLLYEPNATGLLGLEEPENELHPRLLPRLAEELIKATETRQLLVATHSPALLNSLEPEQVWILHRGADGYTQASRVADMPDIVAMVEEGSPLGYLWSRNFFEVGDPLASPSSKPIQE